MFDGMKTYEIAMLIAGGLLFIAAIIHSFINFNKDNAKILIPLFFFVSVVFMGFPYIQSIKIGDLVLEAKDLATKVQNNPNDNEAKEKLRKTLDVLSGRSFSKSNTNLTLIKGYIAIQDTTKAQELLSNVLTNEPGNSEAKKIMTILTNPIPPTTFKISFCDALNEGNIQIINDSLSQIITKLFPKQTNGSHFTILLTKQLVYNKIQNALNKYNCIRAIELDTNNSIQSNILIHFRASNRNYELYLEKKNEWEYSSIKLIN